MDKRKKTDKEITDKNWIEDFLSMPNDYKQTAEEAKAIILKNRNFCVTRQIKNL